MLSRTSKGHRITVVTAKGDVRDAVFLSQDEQSLRCFVRFRSGNTCWIPAERVVDRVE